LGKNRDRLCIVADILEAANSGANKTHIMFGANLSFKLLEKYVGLVVDAGFVCVKGSQFVLTEHGEEFLRQYKEHKEHYFGVKKMLETLDCEREKLDSMCGTSLISTITRSMRIL
jgi:predicted transcriptional regulator